MSEMWTSGPDERPERDPDDHDETIGDLQREDVREMLAEDD